MAFTLRSDDLCFFFLSFNGDGDSVEMFNCVPFSY